MKRKISIELAYLDRGFDRPKVINILKKHNVKFVMLKIKSGTVKSAFAKTAHYPSRVFEDFKIKKGSKDGASVNLVLVDDENEFKRAFICNFDIPPCLTYKLFDLYSKRWGIETGYRDLDQDFKPRTTTKNYNIRLFYFLFSCCLYNLWVLVNICVSLVVYGEIKTKPIITAKMFALMLCKASDPGG